MHRTLKIVLLYLVNFFMILTLSPQMALSDPRPDRVKHSLGPGYTDRYEVGRGQWLYVVKDDKDQVTHVVVEALVSSLTEANDDSVEAPDASGAYARIGACLCTPLFGVVVGLGQTAPCVSRVDRRTTGVYQNPYQPHLHPVLPSRERPSSILEDRYKHALRDIAKRNKVLFPDVFLPGFDTIAMPLPLVAKIKRALLERVPMELVMASAMNEFPIYELMELSPWQKGEADAN